MNYYECWYCWSKDIETDSFWEYEYKWEKYNYEIVVCNEKYNWCNHSWTLIWKMPEEVRDLLYKELINE